MRSASSTLCRSPTSQACNNIGDVVLVPSPYEGFGLPALEGTRVRQAGRH